jgi:probable phosphoglycerate mutase
LGLSIDKFQSFVAEPASISTISIGKSTASVIQSNYKIRTTRMNSFKSNALGGGDLLGGFTKWWNR